MDFLYFLIGLTATTIGALSGIGGGIIIKPALDLTSSLGMSEINLLSSSTVLAMTLVSLGNTIHKKSKLPHDIGSLLGMGSIAGGSGGKILFNFLISLFPAQKNIGALQSAILFLLCVCIILFTRNRAKIHPWHIHNKGGIIIIGACLGGISAFLGIGGGPIIIPALYFFFSLNPKESVITSLYIIFFAQSSSILFSAVTGTLPRINPVILTTMIAGGIGGGIAGSAMGKKFSHRMIDQLFSVVLGIVGMICLINLCNFVS